MKIRASYGTLGNQNVPNYLQIPILPIQTKLPYLINDLRPIYTQIPNLASINLTWETSKTINIGLDASFLNNRIDLSFDWYTRTTEQMFGPGETLPAVFGGSVPQKNNATLETKGFDLSVGWKQQLNDFNYKIGFTLADNKSVVTEYNNPTKLISNYYNHNYPMKLIYYYHPLLIIKILMTLLIIPDKGFQKFSFEILYPAENDGKKPHRLPSPNLDDPSYLLLNSNKYFSL